jgi:hypothetical protein
MVDSIKLTGDADVIVNGIDYVGDIGYTYEMKRYEDVIVALPISVINTPQEYRTIERISFNFEGNLLHKGSIM